MEVPHNNFDSVFKEALTLFRGKVLDFLGLTEMSPITEHLGTESVRIEVTWEFMDLAFGTQDGRGVHLEEEVDLSADDLYRFLGYNIGLSRGHKREFLTVIFVKNPTKITEIKTEQLSFKPIIIQCAIINADAMLARLKNAITEGKPINELEAIYLPLFRSSNLTPTELFIESAGIIKAMQADDAHKRKVLTLLTTLCGKFVDRTQIEAAIEEVIEMGNVIFEYLEERGEKRKQEEIAKKMLAMGMDVLDIMEATGMSVEEVRKLRGPVRTAAVPATQ